MSGTVVSASHAEPATTSNLAAAKERAQLATLLKTYQSDLNKGQSAGALKPLANQIAAAAKSLGQKFTLPQAAIEAAPVVVAAQSGATKLNVSA